MSHNVVVLSGGFDPLHEGHIAMFRNSKKLFDYVVVGLNSDSWLARKKGKPFQSFSTRLSVLASIKYIDEVISFDDTDNSAIALIKQCQDKFPNSTITFGNGGDRSNHNYPEYSYCIENGVRLHDELGGSDKKNSSSSLLTAWKNESTIIRDWGMWTVLQNYDPNTTKIKELVVNPGESLSWQQHSQRAEVWFVREGEATVHHSDYPDKDITTQTLLKNDVLVIPLAKWHKVSNETKNKLYIIEIQYGSSCTESDIVRSTFPRTTSYKS